MFGSSLQTAEVRSSRWKWLPGPQLISRLLGPTSASQCSSKPCVTRPFSDVKTLPPPVIRPEIWHEGSGSWWQPVAGSQLSMVQGSLSSQLTGVKTQPIAGSQVSVVHALLSLHGAFGVNTQPIAGSQVSVVHALLSLHGAFGVNTQPVAGSQVSVVHALLSLHGAFGVNTQPSFGSQVSVVHALLSLHGAFGVNTQPVAGSQVSVVHALLSLHGGFGVKTQPVAGSQVSVVHALLSLHTSGVPGLQPDTVSVEAVNCTVFGVELQPLGEPLQVSETVTEAWSFKGVGSVKTVV